MFSLMLGQNPLTRHSALHGSGAHTALLRVLWRGWGEGGEEGEGDDGYGEWRMRTGSVERMGMGMGWAGGVEDLYRGRSVCSFPTPSPGPSQAAGKGHSLLGTGKVAALPVGRRALGEAQAGDGDASFRCLVPGPLTEMVGLITPSPFPLAVTLFELTVVNNWYIIMVRTLASSWERLPLTLWGQLCVSLHPVWGPCPSHGLRGVASWATGSAFCGGPLRGPRTTPWLDMAFVPAPHPPASRGCTASVLPPTGETFQSRNCGGISFPKLFQVPPHSGQAHPGDHPGLWGRGILDLGTCVFLNRGRGGGRGGL